MILRLDGGQMPGDFRVVDQGKGLPLGHDRDYGHADPARQDESVIVLKRSMRPGFAGVDNELYYDPKCMMLFGDAKESLNKLFAALKG